MTAGSIRWSARDLARRLCRSLGMARQAVDQLAAGGYSDAETPGNDLRAEKVISETALLLLAAATAGDDYPDVRASLDDVARRLLPHARSERMLFRVCLEPALSLDYAFAHICLSRLGYPDRDFDAVLEKSCCAQAAEGRERPPHRVLEQLWAAELRPGPRGSRRRQVRAVARTSLLGASMDLLKGTREDIYAFTHAVLYCARFDLSPVRLPRPRSWILADAEGALAGCLDHEDYDLAGELLLSWPLTGTSWSPAAAFGFRVLARVEDSVGFLPAPTTRVDRLNALHGQARLDYLLATAYHTAYVMGLLCAAALRCGRAPPLEIASRGARRGAASRIVEQLDNQGHCPHWREDFATMKPVDRDAVAPFLLQMAMHRAANTHDFARLRHLLEIGVELDFTDSPMASQAAELLERVASVQRRQLKNRIHAGHASQTGTCVL